MFILGGLSDLHLSINDSNLMYNIIIHHASSVMIVGDIV